MDTPAVEYKAKAFQGHNLAIYFLIVFGLQAIADGLLIAGVLKMPSVEGPGALSDDPRLVVLTLAAWGPIMAPPFRGQRVLRKPRRTNAARPTPS